MASVPPLILASGSPRRAQLLTELGIPFEIVTAPVRELDAASALPPLELARENARLKAEAVAEKFPGRWVLGADTVVALAGRLFGKPASPGQARDFLRALSGRTHEVITGCLLCGPGGARHSAHEVSRVTFLALSEEMITRYLNAVDVLDKAGAYAVQEKSEMIIASVEGSRTNVIGLPAEKLAPLFREQGLLKSG
jgi:septum formation protein